MVERSSLSRILSDIVVLTLVQQSTSLSSNKKKCRTRRRRKRSNNATSDASSTTSFNSSSRSSQKKGEPPPLSLEQQQQQFIAMDCEMVGVGRSGCRSVMARVVLVDWNYVTVYDQFVRPAEPVTDYRTHVSGIMPYDLYDDSYNSSTAIDLATCRRDVLSLLIGKILVGHALKNDLHALHISHPWQDTRDTAKYEPFMKVRYPRDGILWPRKLSELCHEKLGLDIQQPGQAHSAYEDAIAALQLYQSVHTKWEKVMTYKIRKTASIEQQQQQHTTTPTLTAWPALASAA